MFRCNLQRLALPTLGGLCVGIALINFLIYWSQFDRGLNNGDELGIKEDVVESLNITRDTNLIRNTDDVDAFDTKQILEESVVIESSLKTEVILQPDETIETPETIWPTYDVNGSFIEDDRILAQLRIRSPPPMPSPSSNDHSEINPTEPKVIYVPSGLRSIPAGRVKFESDRCPVSSCSLTSDSRYEYTADMQLLREGDYYGHYPRKTPGQIWVLYMLESPMSVFGLSRFNRLINWTATYRTDSTLVTPYEKYVPYEVDDFGFDNSTHVTLSLSANDNRNNVVGRDFNVPNKDDTTAGIRNRKITGNYATGKTRMIAWFVSNCHTSNERWRYMEELRRYVPVDVYGACSGEYKCPRSRQKICDKMLRRDYKFYLAFENANCQYYITEKFFQNALWNDVVPIVMGARRVDYQASAPPHSYIHVEDFPSPRKLATYLIHLNANDSLYNEYFAWKSTPGRFINTFFWCRLCAMLNSDVSKHVTWYDDVDKWWKSGDTCTNTRWGDPETLSASVRRLAQRYF